MYGGNGSAGGGIAAGAALAITGYHTSWPMMLAALLVMAGITATRAGRARVREY